jgi:hypothetical protein
VSRHRRERRRSHRYVRRLQEQERDCQHDIRYKYRNIADIVGALPRGGGWWSTCCADCQRIAPIEIRTTAKLRNVLTPAVLLAL